MVAAAESTFAAATDDHIWAPGWWPRCWRPISQSTLPNIPQRALCAFASDLMARRTNVHASEDVLRSRRIYRVAESSHEWKQAARARIFGPTVNSLGMAAG